MGLFDAPRLLFKAKKPVASDLDKYIGKTILIPTFAEIDGKKTRISEDRVTIETIVGNKFHEAFYEINGKYRIGMLRFYKQMNKVSDSDITEDDCQAFEEMILHCEKVKK